MLIVTHTAAEAIRTLLDSAEVPQDGGIRISMAHQNGAQASLELAVTPAPMEGDEVLEEEGVHVFLDEVALVALEDKSLDAEVHGDEISFGIVEQDEGGL